MRIPSIKAASFKVDRPQLAILQLDRWTARLRGVGARLAARFSWAPVARRKAPAMARRAAAAIDWPGLAKRVVSPGLALARAARAISARAIAVSGGSLAAPLLQGAGGGARGRAGGPVALATPPVRLRAGPAVPLRAAIAPRHLAAAPPPPRRAASASAGLAVPRLPRLAATAPPVSHAPVAPAATSGDAAPPPRQAAIATAMGQRGPAGPPQAAQARFGGRFDLEGWLEATLSDAACRPPTGLSGFDERLTPVFAGMTGPN